MKFLIVSDYACINGGCAKVAIDTALGLSSMGHEVVFFAGGGETCFELEQSNIEVINLKLPDLLTGNKMLMFFRGIRNKKAMVALNDLLDKMKDEVIIHIHSWVKVLSPGIFFVLAKRKKTFFITAHDYFLICPNGGYYNFKKNKICSLSCRKKCIFVNCDSRNYIIKLWRYYRGLRQRNYLKKCSYNIITLSSLMKLQFELKGINSSIISNPINLYNGNISIDEDCTSFAYIGRLSSEKGVKLFCDALASTGYKGYIFGGGPLEKRLYNEYGKYGNIHFMGWMSFDKISAFFPKILCLVFPSIWYEGAPLTIPECQSYGIYCLVSDACSGIEYLNKNNGMSFESNNLQDLIEKMDIIKEKKTNIEIRKKIQKDVLLSQHNISQYSIELVNFMGRQAKK